MKKLDQYIRSRRLTSAAFAALVGVDPQTVWRWRHNRVVPSPQAMSKIASVTNGAITPNDLVPMTDGFSAKQNAAE